MFKSVDAFSGFWNRTFHFFCIFLKELTRKTLSTYCDFLLILYGSLLKIPKIFWKNNTLGDWLSQFDCTVTHLCYTHNVIPGFGIPEISIFKATSDNNLRWGTWRPDCSEVTWLGVARDVMARHIFPHRFPTPNSNLLIFIKMGQVLNPLISPAQPGALFFN